MYFFSFPNNLYKNLSKNLRSGYSEKLLDQANKSATDTFKIPSEITCQKL